MALARLQSESASFLTISLIQCNLKLGIDRRLEREHATTNCKIHGRIFYREKKACIGLSVNLLASHLHGRTNQL